MVDFRQMRKVIKGFSGEIDKGFGMEVVEYKKEIRNLVWQKRCGGEKIGFVPTMGFLHEGHLSLIREAKRECDVVVVSIFVNPRQFNNKEDLERYPIDLEGDLELLRSEGVDLCFLPKVEEMYGEETFVEIGAGELVNCLCGKSRPGHFGGVMLVVAKLFNIVGPDVVYFGQKDYQQCLVVKKLIEDLDFGIEMRILPTVRDEFGLALSSRNSRLSEEGLRAARNIVQILYSVERSILTGKVVVSELIEEMVNKFSVYSGLEVDYAEIRRAEDLSEIEEIDGEVVVAVAVNVEGVRLIDNILVSCT